MKICIAILFITGLTFSLVEPIQFGLFQQRTTSDASITTHAPRTEAKFNLLKPVSSLLNLLGTTLETLGNLLTGGLRYKPYKRISTTPSPIGVPNITISEKTILTSSTTDVTTTTTAAPTTITTTTIISTATSPKNVDTITTIAPTTNTDAPTTNVDAPITTTTLETTITTNTTEAAITTPTTTTPPTTTIQVSITEEGKPGNVDWRRLNCMSTVRFQGKCSGSFAFATATAIEAQLCIKTGKQIILSPQNLIDCTIASPFQNSGCDGGSLEPTYDYIVNVGINTEDDYPYVGTVSKCKFKQDKSIGRIKDYISIDEGDEETMERVLNTIGPITVGMDASQESFKSYTGGIYFDRKCKSDMLSLNHAVLLVGYGEEPDGKKYWLIRNSYGTKWGDQGYGKIARTNDNHCGIATYVVYPIVF